MLDFTGNQGDADESSNEIWFFTRKIGKERKGFDTF